MPAAPYADDPALLAALQQLGLRDRLEPTEVLTTARTIASLPAGAPSCEWGGALLRCAGAHDPLSSQLLACCAYAA